MSKVIKVKNQTLCFIHIPKNGGSSINSWLNAYFKNNTTKVGGKHDTIFDVRNTYGRKINKYFCVKRNPYARLVSWYNFRLMMADRHIKQGKNHLAADPKLTEKYARDHHYGDDFTRWLEKIDFESPRGHNYDYSIIRTQKSFIDPKLPPFLILELNNLNREFHQIQTLMGNSQPLPHKNASKQVDWKKYYNDTRAELVQQHWGEDFDYFGYDRNSYK